MNEWIEEVHALADGELEGEAKERAIKLVETDERAAAEYQWASYLKQTVSAKCSNTGHDDAWKQCQARLDEIDAVSSDTRVESFVGRFGWAMASVLFLLILSAGWLNWGIGNNEISSSQFASLLSGEAPFEQIDVDSAQGADKIVRDRVGARLPYVEPVVQVLGVGHCEIDGNRVVRVDLLDNVGRLSLYIFEDAESVESLEPIPHRTEYSGGQYNGLIIVSWTEDDHVLMVVAERNVDEMVSIADRMRASG